MTGKKRGSIDVEVGVDDKTGKSKGRLSLALPDSALGALLMLALIDLLAGLVFAYFSYGEQAPIKNLLITLAAVLAFSVIIMLVFRLSMRKLESIP